MPSLPQKSVKGANFKKWAVDSIDRIIDYLSSPYLQNGKGISIRRTPSGTVIELERQPASAPQSAPAGGGGGASGIESSVSGGTASVTLTGGTGSVNFVGTGSVTISGNTNTGNIEINGSGGTGSVGFPDYATTPISVSDSTPYPIGSDMWLIGTVGLYKTSSSGFPSYVRLKISSSDGSTLLRSFYLFDDTGTFSSYNSNQNFDFNICIPISSGYRIEVVKSGSATFDLSLFYT